MNTEQAGPPGTEAPFSYAEYTRIIEAYRPMVRDFGDVATANDASLPFCLIRHDVEFSLARARALAELDARLGIRSSFFVQVKNGAYNPLAPLQARVVRALRELGHFVGLHLYVTDVRPHDTTELLRQLRFQTTILEEVLGEPISRFSYHRPPRWTLELDLSGETDLLNAYAPRFFELTEGQGPPKHIRYLADSQHAWKYGHPLEVHHRHGRFQILMHPDEWSDAGSSVAANFRELTDDHQEAFLQTLLTECNHYEPHAPASP